MVGEENMRGFMLSGVGVSNFGGHHDREINYYELLIFKGGQLFFGNLNCFT